MPRSSGSRREPGVVKKDDKLDRRSNPELRLLIDEMLERVRALNRNARTLADEDYSRAEAELESVMARVRRVAMKATTEK